MGTAWEHSVRVQHIPAKGFGGMRTDTMKNFNIRYSEITSETISATNNIHSVLPVCSVYIHMEIVIAHANT